MSITRRILFLNHVSRASGAERSLLDLVRHLDRRRFDPVVAMPAAGELTEFLASYRVRCFQVPMRRMRKTVNPLHLAGNLLNVVQVIHHLTRLIRVERITLVHANSNLAQLYGGPAARLAGVPCVWHTRDLVPLGLLGRWLGRFASRTIAISDCVRQCVQPYVRAPETLRTIRNGIDIGSLVQRGDRSQTRAEFGLPADVPVLAMIGQMVPWKGHQAFIEMAACIVRTVPTARFMIVGGDLFFDHPGYGNALEARAAELGLREHMMFTGYRHDAVRVMDAADVLVHPARREPLGRVILEAMAIGKPVVAVNACGPAEIIQDGVNGLLTESDRPEDLADAVLRVIRDPLLARRLGTAARHRVEEGFNITNTVRDIEAVYHELLYRGRTPCA